MASSIAPMSLGVLVELINGWGTVPRREAREEDQPYPPLERLTEAHGAVRSTDRVDDAGAREFADRLYPVFAAPEPAQQVGLVNRLLAETDVRPMLRAQAEDVTEGWLAGDRHALLGSAALALHHQIAVHGLDRLGTCTGARCADAYIDASPNNQRRYCSITCQNRARVAAYRRRKSG